MNTQERFKTWSDFKFGIQFMSLDTQASPKLLSGTIAKTYGFSYCLKLKLLHY
jgi:hypothetical protein